MRLTFFFALIFALACGHAQHDPASKQPSGKPALGAPNAVGQQAAFPAYVLETLDFVKKNSRPPDGFVGGREFQNREKNLPQRTPHGQKIRYREWDVHPKTPGKNRGAERLVTGSDGSAWFTRDHYSSFSRIE